MIGRKSKVQMSKEEKAKVVIFHRLFDDSVCLANFFYFSHKSASESLLNLLRVWPRNTTVSL